MKTRRGLLFASLLVFLCLPLTLTVRGDDAKKDDKKEISGDLKKMQGEWVSKDDQGESTWKFKEDKLSIKTPTRGYEITLTLDPKAKPHPTMDLKVDDDSPNAKGVTGLAIYKFDGEKKFSICMGAGEAERPKEFKSDFPQTILFELSKK
jgi:uncharacterized protein (TIGR03067 family)